MTKHQLKTYRIETLYVKRFGTFGRTIERSIYGAECTCGWLTPFHTSGAQPVRDDMEEHREKANPESAERAEWDNWYPWYEALRDHSNRLHKIAQAKKILGVDGG